MGLCRPYREATASHISQFFGVNKALYGEAGHAGLDWVYRYGTFLVAPERCVVTNIITPNKLLEEGAEEWRGYAQYGYGIVMKSLSAENTYHLYWHCLPVFPVNVGDEVRQGQVVAQMGNWGFVFTSGVYVPIELRNKEPFPGTHLHQEIFREVNGVREYLNPIGYIDFDIEVRYDFLTAAKNILNKMLGILGGH